jgi:hypothetical protein
MINYAIENLTNIKLDKEEIILIRKKIDILFNSINEIKEKDIENNDNINKNIDLNKFIEISIFNEFKNNADIRHLNIQNRFDEFERMIDDIYTMIDNKSNLEDIRKLEDIFINKLDDLKNFSIKKFSDKPESFKHFKVLESKIKSIQEKDKNKEKGDNWLIAKKPVNGYACASCESYIGDLPNKNQPIHWNKFINRDGVPDFNKTSYRVLFIK